MRDPRARRPAALLLVALALHATPACAREPGAPAGERRDRATSTHGFEDVERWVEVFDAADRDAWQQPARLVAALGLEPGDAVADVGAGTGYLNAHLARRVGERGVVFAVDLEPRLVAHVRDRAEREATPNVVPVLASADDPRLPPARIDVALFLNTYHHIDLRRDYFRRFRRFLAPGGRLVVVDWRTDVETTVGPPEGHRLAVARVVEELDAAGYELVGSIDFLPHQYGRVFRLAPDPGR